MKKIASLVIFLVLAVQLVAQEPVKNRDYYLTKSKKQKSAAIILLAGGGAAVAVGLLIGDSKESSFDDAATGVIVGGVGVLSMIGSIPLFIASGKNKRKAANLVIHTGRRFDPLAGANKRMIMAGITVSL
jgi:hypothetical protein